MAQRVIKSEADKERLIRFLDQQELPVTVAIVKGGYRSNAQNRLQHLWVSEIAQQLEDRTVEEIRAYCKLHIGVPILREENRDFRDRYDEVFKPIPYEVKLQLMGVPFDFPTTRLMTVAQKNKYLDHMQKHWAEKGIVLTDPQELSWAAHIASYKDAA